MKPVVSATDLILRLIEHEVPEYGLVHLLDLPEQRLEIIEMLLPEDSKAHGVRVSDLEMPEGSLLISVLREGKGFVPGPDTVLESGRRDPGGARSDGRGGSDLVLRPRRGLRERRVSDRSVDFLVVGGGMAAANCASELRRKGADGSVLVVGREPEPPYERPPLSKEYLRGEAERKDAYVNEPGWYEENDVELLSGTNVMSLDVEARTAKLQTKEEVEFDKALIATGREREHPPRRGGGAGGDPLPARVRQLGRDPRGGRQGRSTWS